MTNIPPHTAKKRQKSTPFGNYIQKALAKRLPKKDEQTLSIHNVYVFFSRSGMMFFCLLVITFIAGVNYGNNLILGLFFYLLSIWLVASVLTYLQVSPLGIRLQNVSLGEAQGLLWVDIEVHNSKSKASRQIELSFEMESDEALALLNPQDLTTYLANRHLTLTVIKDKVNIRLPIIAHKRGAIPLPRLTIKSHYPIGSVQAWSYVYFQSTGFAYPKPIAFDWRTTHKSVASDDEHFSNRYQAGQADFDMLDDYVEGESLARVSWAHVARGAGMLTKRFADPLGRQWRLDYHDMPAIHHEEKLGELAYAVLAMQASDTEFELILPHDSSGDTSGGASGAGEAFVQVSLLRLAKSP